VKTWDVEVVAVKVVVMVPEVVVVKDVVVDPKQAGRAAIASAPSAATASNIKPGNHATN
jgi:hypothetical protein